jgi:hypothetical protein
MTRTVLLIEPDVDVLGALASKLRSRGLEVWIADGLDGALTRARAGLPQVVLVSGDVAAESGFADRIGSVAGLADVPRFRLVEAPANGELESGALPRNNGEAIAQRVHAVPARAAQTVESSDFRGDLTQVSVPDLLQLLSMNRRSGTLTLQTPLGTGEVRMFDGEIVDALYRRLEGQKALFRLLGERDGTFSFGSGASMSLLRRIDLPTSSLLMEGMRQFDEVRRLREALDLEGDGLIAVGQPNPDASETIQMLFEMLATPRTIAELLDEVPVLDLEVLTALSELLETGAARRIPFGTQRVELADPERLGVLAALAKRVARAGFRGPPRVGIAASPRRLLGILAALGRIAEAMLPSEAVPTAPIPHVLATLRLGDGVDLDVIGVPLVEAYAPLWAFVLPGCTSLAIADPTSSELLENACSLASVPIVEARPLLGDDDDCDAGRVAALVQRLLESAAGG